MEKELREILEHIFRIGYECGMKGLAPSWKVEKAISDVELLWQKRKEEMIMKLPRKQQLSYDDQEIEDARVESFNECLAQVKKIIEEA